MRLDYPAHLGSEYRALDAYGANLRTKLGVGFRRSIKFSDDDMSLYMDIYIPEAKEWIKVTANMAKEQRNFAKIDGEKEAQRKIDAFLNKAGVASGANSVPVFDRNSQGPSAGRGRGGLSGMDTSK